LRAHQAHAGEVDRVESGEKLKSVEVERMYLKSVFQKKGDFLISSSCVRRDVGSTQLESVNDYSLFFQQLIDLLPRVVYNNVEMPSI
jgi:hypothetical protein